MNLAALGQVAKALSAATAGATGALGTAAVQGGVTPTEIAVVILTALGAFFAAFFPRNTPAPTEGS